MWDNLQMIIKEFSSEKVGNQKVNVIIFSNYTHPFLRILVFNVTVAYYTLGLNVISCFDVFLATYATIFWNYDRKLYICSRLSNFWELPCPLWTLAILAFHNFLSWSSIYSSSQGRLCVFFFFSPSCLQESSTY